MVGDDLGKQVAAGFLYGGLAQLGEHLPCKQGVESSNLFISIQNSINELGLIAQLVRAHA